MSKTGIMGGTFDPIHIGHIRLAEQAMAECKLDSVLFVPNHTPWMKHDRAVTKAEQRAAMTELAIEGHPGFGLSTVEIDAGGDSYTWQTLETLKEQYPDEEFFFILGADSLLSIEKWAHPEKIFENAAILAAVRDDCDKTKLEEQKELLTSKYNARIRLLSMPFVDVSSTKIRQEFYIDPEIQKLVPPKTAAYILQNHLYSV